MKRWYTPLCTYHTLLFLGFDLFTGAFAFAAAAAEVPLHGADGDGDEPVPLHHRQQRQRPYYHPTRLLHLLIAKQ